MHTNQQQDGRAARAIPATKKADSAQTALSTLGALSIRMPVRGPTNRSSQASLSFASSAGSFFCTFFLAEIVWIELQVFKP